MPVFTVPFEDFGGLDLASATNETGGSPDLLNVEFDQQGRVRSRDGFSKLTAAAGATRYDSVFAVATSAAQPSSAKFPGTGADDATAGTIAWANPMNITVLAGGTADVTLSFGQTSHYLSATNFGFAIPGGATITGILVNLDGATFGSTLVDGSVKLVKAGVISGSDRAGAPGASYGGATDMWGLTLTPANVNAANFGVVYSAFGRFVGSSSTHIDAVTMTVYYTLPVVTAVAAAAGSRLDVLAADGSVSLSLPTATDTQSSYVAFGSPSTGATYIANSGTTIRKLVGITPTTPAGMPKAKYVAITSPSNRLVAANVNQIPTSASSTASTSLVHFSDPGLPETWSPNNYVYVTPGDNEDIQGVCTWRTNTIVFKSSKFFVFYGESADSTGQPVFNYRRVDGAGLAAPLALAVSPGGVYFMDRRGIYFTSGGPPQHISQTVDALWRGGARAEYTSGIINPSALAQASMAWFQDRLYVGLPLGSATTNDHTLVFDPATGTWTLWDIPMGAMSATASQPGRLLFTYAQGTNDVGQYAPNAYTTDAGTTISSRYRSPYIPLDWRGRTIRSGIHGVDKTVRESLLEGSGSVTYALATQWTQPVSMPAGNTVTMGTAPQVAMSRDRTAVRGRMFSWQISAAAPWSLETLSWNVHGYQAAGEEADVR